MERELVEDILLHLEAVQGCYPEGIAESALVPIAAEPAVAAGDQSSGWCYRGPESPELLLLVTYGAVPPAEQEAGRVLLSAAITKGLQRPLDEIGVLEILDEEKAKAGVLAQVAQRGARVVAALGASAWSVVGGDPAAAQGVFVESPHGVWLRTEPLLAMVTDPGAKKRFWNDLKGIMNQLGWRAS